MVDRGLILTYLFLDPPNSKQAIAFFMSILPYMEGAILFAITSYTSGLDARRLNSSSSRGFKGAPVLWPGPSVSTLIPTTLRYGFRIPTPMLSRF